METGVVELVQFLEAAPIAPVMKPDGSVRIRGDYRSDCGQTYPLPQVENLFASLAGRKKFSKLDLAHAYQQVQLGDDSQKFTTINT